jgi:hypothetical protein
MYFKPVAGNAPPLVFSQNISSLREMLLKSFDFDMKLIFVFLLTVTLLIL